MTIEKDISSVEPGRYIIAVSGGVDSMALLHSLSRRGDIELIAVYVDHGIRPKSETSQDIKVIKKACHKYSVKFESTALKLGANTSEANARTERYKALRKFLRQHKCKRIITAHHQDDVIETMMINILRGTGRSGLTSLKTNSDIIRPLVNISKTEIIDYANSNKLEWNEDSTNEDEKYLRNYVRQTILPKMLKNRRTVKDEMLTIHANMSSLNVEIDKELAKLFEELADDDAIVRSKLIMLPIGVSYSLLHYILSNRFKVEVSAKLIYSLRNFIHTASPGKVFEVSKNLKVIVDADLIKFQSIRNQASLTAVK